jgi:hypothetical protein
MNLSHSAPLYAAHRLRMHGDRHPYGVLCTGIIGGLLVVWASDELHTLCARPRYEQRGVVAFRALACLGWLLLLTAVLYGGLCLNSLTPSPMR